MKHLLVAILLVISSGPIAFAQTAKVIKVKGQQAIVQFPQGTKPTVGQAIDVGGGGGGGDFGGGGGGGATGSRAHTIGLSGELSAKSTSTNVAGSKSTSTTTLAATGRYGWNDGVMEYGPIVAIALDTTEVTGSTTLEAGGFFDYNLVPNTPGNDLVYGLGAEATVGQRSPKQGDSATLMGFAGGGQAKWFILGNSAAFRGDVFFAYDRMSAGQVTTTSMGLVTRVGLQVYF